MRPRDYLPEDRLKRAARLVPKEDLDPMEIIAAGWHTPEPLLALAAEARAATSEGGLAAGLHPQRSVELFGSDLCHPSVHRAAANLGTRENL